MVSHHQRDPVTSQAVSQQLGELAVPVRDVDPLVGLLLGAQLSDAVTEDHEALVDIVGLLEGLPLTFGLLGHLAPGEVHEVDLAVSGDEDSLDTNHQTMSRSHLLRYSPHWKPSPRCGCGR